MLFSFWHFLTFQNEKYKYYLAILALFCASLVSWAWYPGFVSDDVMTQYLQAIGAAPLTDAHPPISTLFFWLEIKFFHTANLLNATWIFLSALGLFLFLRLKPCLLSCLIFLILFFSPVFCGISGFVWKDLALTWLLLISAALLLTLYKTQKNILFFKILITFLLLLCCLLRANGAFIAVPLLVATWWGWYFDFKHLSLCLAFVVLSIPAMNWVNHKIFRASNEHMEVSLEIFDLAGISFFRHHKIYDDKIERSPLTYRELFAHWEDVSAEEKLAACYDPRLWDSFGAWNLDGYPYKHGGGRNKWNNGWINRELVQDNITFFCPRFGRNLWNEMENGGSHQWINAIRNNPIPYLKHRFNHFKTNYLTSFYRDSGLLASASGYQTYGSFSGYFHVGDNDKLYETSPRQVWLIRNYIALVNFFPHLWLRYGLFWISLALILFVTTIGQKDKKNSVINLLSFAAVCYFFGYFLISVANEWRYIAPSVALVISSFLVWYIEYGKLGTSISRRVAIAILAGMVLLGLFYKG